MVGLHVQKASFVSFEAKRHIQKRFNKGVYNKLESCILNCEYRCVVYTDSIHSILYRIKYIKYNIYVLIYLHIMWSKQPSGQYSMLHEPPTSMISSA